MAFPIPLTSGASKLSLRMATDFASGGRYDFKEELGRGAFGVVFLARDRKHNIDVAIKLVTIPAQLQLSDYFISLFGLDDGLTDAQKEANLLRELRHHYVIGYLDSYKFRTDEVVGAGIVMRYCPGGNLDSYLLRNGRPAEQLRRRWCRELAEGMNFVHSQGVTHRDLKPDNILIDSDSCLKIADIGLAKAAWDMQENALSGKYATERSLNQYMSSVKGTTMYMAPEVLSGRYTKACDVFSLGLVFVAIIEAPVIREYQQNILAPLAVWQSCSRCYGDLLYYTPSSRSYKPSALLRLSIATGGESRLIDHMLLFHPKDRYDMKTVLSTLQGLQDIQHISKVTLQARDPPPVPNWSCCS